MHGHGHGHGDDHDHDHHHGHDHPRGGHEHDPHPGPAVQPGHGRGAPHHHHEAEMAGEGVAPPEHHPGHGPLPERGHEGSHEHAGAPARPLLTEGYGRGKVLFLDTFSGISGDMTIAALLDLGVPLLVIERALSALPLEAFHLHRGHAHRSAIVATSFEVHIEGDQPLRTWSTIDAMLAAAPLDAPVADLARRIFRRLGVAEATVHRTTLEDVHFHEVGAVDAIVDIVGAAAAFAWLGADVVCAPLPMGRGFVRAAHGPLPLPAPAVVSCLEGCPTYAVDLDFELVTPTGAAIAASVAKRFERWPSISPSRVGFGAGRRELPDRPNLLRVVLGDPAGTERSETAAPAATHVVVEANVDDMTGELAGHAIEALLSAGALDAWAVPATMKKGRPGLVISGLAEVAHADAVGAAMLRETTSIGVRTIPITRTERPRRSVTVRTPFGEVRVKVSEGPYGPAQVKPEFDDCARLAKESGVPVREVVAAATAAARREI
jgi:uncharacterized protein (TIGR00299 family) protein